ncbi:MAG TPA: NADH-quinone oxidoreductase subunit NuoH [Candidatus Limnocylindrales bacterium]|nr:NADH-quinone oxidoreductase subunit NuoH [Candidatus Limnocylindrales bacterium]
MAPGPFGLDATLWTFLRLILAILLAVGLVFNGALAQIYLERKIQAIIQDRSGPIHTGPWGLLQTFADAIKLLGKEDIRAKLTDRWFFLAAPAIVFAPMIASYAVIPFAPGVVGADLNIGLLYLTTLGSMTVLGIVIAGWASNNKYSLIGGLRSAGQLISYEVPQILSLVTVVLVVGSLSMTQIVDSQDGLLINVLILPLAFVTYFIAGLAETNRVPFDLPEAESELVAGFLTEYSGMRWGLFFVAEYGEVTVVSAILTTLWFGGWHGPFVDIHPLIGPVLGVLWFTLKTYFFVLVFMWIRATLPRFRIDQLMSFCWKMLIPVTLTNLLVTAILLLAFPGSVVPVAVANWLMLFGFALAVPYLQRRRLASLRARLAARAAA